MKTRNLRPALYPLALAAAFVSGWGLRPTINGRTPGPVSAALSRGLERDTTRNHPETGTRTAVPVSARATDAAGDSASLPLEALRSLSRPGAAATPLEKLALLAQFGEQDPETALTYVDTLPPAERAAGSATVMSAWAARDPEAAAAYLENEAGGFGLGGKEAGPAAAAIALEWAPRDPASAILWAAALPDELRSAALTAATGTATEADIFKAREVLASLPDSSLRAEASAPLASQWAATDPQSAAAWAGTLSSAAERSAAVSGVASAWMLRDPAAASQWVNSLPAGDAKDAAIVALTNSPAIRNDAGSAAAWAGTIGNTALRDRALASALQRWRYQQPEAFAGTAAAE